MDKGLLQIWSRDDYGPKLNLLTILAFDFSIFHGVYSCGPDLNTVVITYEINSV